MVISFFKSYQYRKLTFVSDTFFLEFYLSDIKFIPQLSFPWYMFFHPFFLKLSFCLNVSPVDSTLLNLSFVLWLPNLSNPHCHPHLDERGGGGVERLK